jgi:two-component system LytT family response regulator
MQQYTCVIIDDEISNLKLLKHFIATFLPNLKIIGEATNVEEGINTINSEKPEILFLDIQLNEKNAFDILNNLDLGEFEIIFVTAFEDYALKAFKYNAIDYVLKPIIIDDLILAVRKCIRRIEEKKSFLIKDHSLIKKKATCSSKFISIASINKVDVIKMEDIIFCKSDGRYTSFYLINNEEIIACKNLGQFEEILDDTLFFRIHHSYIINLNHLISITKNTGYYCEMVNEINLPIAKRRQESLRTFLKSRRNIE